MKRRYFLATLLATALLSVVQAHEFWLQPDRFFYNPGEQLAIAFQVGENFTGETWKPAGRIKRMEVIGASQKQTIPPARLVPDEKQKISISLPMEGTYMVTLESNNSFISLDGEKFNEYLKEDGLDETYYFREKNNQLADSAREYYSRHTKLLVQVGDKTDASCLQKLGMPIEIVPAQNPYILKRGDAMKFTILFRNKPVFGARVKVWNRYNNRTTVQNIYSQQDGTIETHISNPGAWMVSVVQMVPSDTKDADWRSYWGSLVFGVK